MKKGTKNILRVVISIIYIIWGIYSPISVLQAVLALNVPAIVSAAVGVLMLLAGIFGLFGMKKNKCRVFGIVVFIAAVVGLPNRAKPKKERSFHKKWKLRSFHIKM